MTTTAVIAIIALCTGFVAGAAFAAIGVPIPAPPTITGVLGILGIYLGFRTVEHLGIGVDLLAALGS